MVVDLMFPTVYVQGAGGPRVTDVVHVAGHGPRILTDYPTNLVEIGN